MSVGCRCFVDVGASGGFFSVLFAASVADPATIVSVEGASTTYHTRDWNGKPVTVRIPSQSAADIKGKDAEGTVRAIITAVDPASQRVKVRTSENQTIVLAMAPDSLASLKRGDLFIFTIPETPRT